jgi:undecaprenyl diphosphate synthase
VGFIMDGNGRWAAQRGLPRTAGHEAGAEAAERLLRYISDETTIRYVTLYAFSTENWRRPAAEVSFLMQLLRRFLAKRLDELLSKGARLLVSGDLARLPEPLRDAIDDAVRRSGTNRGTVLHVALNYGGREEIVRACRAIAERVRQGGLASEDIDERVFAEHLYTAELPDPDLVVRTGGEQRVSNFLLWQIAYAELWMTDVLWPEFTVERLEEALEAYRGRERRYGGLGGPR